MLVVMVVIVMVVTAVAIFVVIIIGILGYASDEMEKSFCMTNFFKQHTPNCAHGFSARGDQEQG